MDLSQPGLKSSPDPTVVMIAAFALNKWMVKNRIPYKADNIIIVDPKITANIKPIDAAIAKKGVSAVANTFTPQAAGVLKGGLNRHITGMLMIMLMLTSTIAIV